MAQPTRQLSEQEEKRIAEEAKAIQKQQQEKPPEHEGDILGLSDASPAVEIPRATEDRGGHPAGIEVRSPTTGTSELKQTKGATGIDMGAAGSGTDLDPDDRKPAAGRHDLND
jgi:BRCT domain type II-containing protein